MTSFTTATFCSTSSKSGKTATPSAMRLRRTPLAQAAAVLLMAGAAGGGIGNAVAAQPFSAGWYAGKGALQDTARATGMVNGKSAASFSTPAAQQQQASAQLKQSIANLSLAAHGIAMMQAQQAAWRQAALGNPSSISDGLGVNGLDTGSLASSWINASAPTQSTDASGKIVVDIVQTADKAIANWESFNVGRNTIVQFDQASSDWAILNRINDPLAPPSQIQGQIRAPGTVLIVNRNGIVFSGSSQINMRNLVAAAADISDSQFTTAGIYGASQAPSFTNASGKLIVEAGAQITTGTPSTVTQGGGYVLLMGQQVSNAGDIETPKGQVELAAGDNFIIRKGVGTDANQSSTTRGNEISPQLNAGSTAGQVVNTGLLLAREGDVTLAGHDVQQNGVAVATTSVNTRGTIHLLNSASDSTGLVTLGAGAVTAVALSDDGATALDSQRAALIAASPGLDNTRLLAAAGVFNNLSPQTDRQDQSRVEIVSGGDVRFDGTSLTLATGGQIAVSAAHRSFVADGAILDVSGQVGVNLAMSSNNVVVNVQGNELRDSPDNRDSGNLFNSNITVDRRDLILVPAGDTGAPGDRWYTANGLLEVSGYLNNQGHSIGEWAAQGGTIQLSGNEVVTQAGSQINLSGGSLNVATGYVAQTWLVGSDGNLYTAGNAPANMTFSGVYKGFEVSHPRWGKDASVFFYNPLIAPQKRLENGYTVGRDAGQLIVNAPTAVMEGEVIATVYQGPQQVRARDAVADAYLQAQTATPKAATLSFGQYGPGGLLAVGNTDIRIGDIAGVTDSMAADAALPVARSNTLWLDAGPLSAQGWGEIDLATSGTLSIDALLTLHDGGVLNLIAPVVDFAADVTAHSGSITASNVFQSALPNAHARELLLNNAADVIVHDGVTLDVSGLWVNALPDGGDTSKSAFINGGAVTLESTGDVTLATGSLIDVSSGAAILGTGKTLGGKGGNVSLIADSTRAISTLTGSLTLNGDISAYGVSGGGTLKIESGPGIAIGGHILGAGGVLGAGEKSPVDVVTTQDLLILAGETLPIDYHDIKTLALPGQPIGGPPLLTTPVTLQDDWTIPPATGTGLDAYVLLVNGVFWSVRADGIVNTSGQGNLFHPVIPRGSTIQAFNNTPLTRFPATYVVPGNVFPAGLQIQPSTVIVPAGTPAPRDVVVPAGTRIAGGMEVPRSVTVTPMLELDTGLFQTGFSSYQINGHQGVAVADGATLNVSVPVYRFRDGANAVATNASADGALVLWTPPVYTENPLTDTLTQRAGADLTLASGPDSVAAGPVSIGTGALINVDPGHAITLTGTDSRPVTVDGVLNAWGGQITISSAGGIAVLPVGQSSNNAIWIGDHAVLDAAGRAVTAQDQAGRTYGIVQDGGTIAIGGTLDWEQSGQADAPELLAVIRPGAVLDASGAGAALDVAARGLNASAVPVFVAGNGGSIVVKSSNGIYLDGTMRAAAGGAGAAGGTLALALETPVYNTVQTSFVDDRVRTPREVVIAAQQGGSGFDASVTPGAVTPDIPYGRGRLGVDQIRAGGFDNLAILSNGLISFDGDVTLHMAQSLRLYSYALALTDASAADAHVALSAPYVLLAGATRHLIGTPGELMPTVTNAMAGLSQRADDATFAVNADMLDIRDLVGFGAHGDMTQNNGSLTIDRRGFSDVDLVSSGDVRLLQNDGPTSIQPTFPRGTPAQGLARTMIVAPDDLTITAAQVYPATDAFARIQAGDTLTIQRYDYTPDTPYSLFGKLVLDAATVNQGGVVRAPGGLVQIGDTAAHTNLLSGSLTSASMDGMQIPFGGTTDGLSWLYNGAAVNLATTGVSVIGAAGVTLGGTAIDVRSGAIIDLRGGGEVSGAGFISGRGGSVDVLMHSLADANPAFSFSKPGNRVYALMPGFGSGYAPIAPDAGAGDPAIGQQITIPAGVPGLAAGTYTLLPSTYALLPGAFRVEIGAVQQSAPSQAGALAAGNGSYLAQAYLGTANTGIRAALPNQVIVTSAAAVRDYSTYNETSFSQFSVKRAADLGWPRPPLPMDGKPLSLVFNDDAETAAQTLQFAGTALFAGSAGGDNGYATVTGKFNGVQLEILGPQSDKTANYISIDDKALTALGAPMLIIGGTLLPAKIGVIVGPQAFLGANASSVLVRSGAVLNAGDVMLVSSSGIDVEAGASISTLGMGAAPFNAAEGYVLGSDLATNILAVSNDVMAFLPVVDNGSGNGIQIGNCLHASCTGQTQLYSEGSISLLSSNSIDIAPTVSYGTRELLLGVAAVNIGTDAALAQASAASVLPNGLIFNQDIFNRLLAGNQGVGIPKLESLVLTARDSVNFFGSVDLSTIDPATGKSSLKQFVMSTPAIYGYGSAADVATLSTDTLIWSGIYERGAGSTAPATSIPAGAVIPGGAGTGHGTLNITASNIVLGYGDNVQAENQVMLDRLMLGFDTVNLTASTQIGGNAKGSLSVYQSQTGANTYTGGNLHITTPLLTGAAGSTLSVTAGGALSIDAPASADLAASNADALGATLNLKGGSVTVDSAIVLPSGRLTLTADGDIVLSDRARIDMTGRTVQLFDLSEYSWGGDVAIESANGNVTQAAGSVIDVSAQNNAAGSLTVTALSSGAGHIDLGGVIRGTVTGSYDAGGGAMLTWLSGGVEVRGQTIADFSGLNQRLNAGGLFGERTFQTKQGDLVIGDEIRANLVDISVDGGSLTVNGLINAGGERVGTIRLAARDLLTLAAGAKLDAHGTVLRVDSDGDAIDAPNRAVVELTSSAGRVVLQSGATLDLRAADAVARGTLTFNAQRLTETGGDIGIDAGGVYDIRGAGSIVVNGFWSYSPSDAGGTIVQNNGGTAPRGADGVIGLDQIDQQSQTFMNNALGNGSLQTRLAGLKAYDGPAGIVFHLRPGVEINSKDTPGGNLTVKGDLDLSGYRYGPDADRTPGSPTYGAGEPGALVIRPGGNLDVQGSINDGFAPPPATPEDDLGWMKPHVFLAAGQTSTSTISFLAPFVDLFFDNYFLFPGTDIFGSSTTFVTVVSGQVSDSDTTYGPNDVIPGFLHGTITIAPGTLLSADNPADAVIAMDTPETGHRLWAVAPMLAAGSMSWDIRLAAGADLAAASQRALQSASRLNGAGNMTLSDAHVLANSAAPVFSVVRTGTGDLDILAGGNFSEDSLYGVYTAGTQSQAILDGTGNNPYNLPRGLNSQGVNVLGDANAAYEPLVHGNNYQAWYPEHGGNLSMQINGDFTGNMVSGGSSGINPLPLIPSGYVGNWLWTQGGADQRTAWWINFGTYGVDATQGEMMALAGFSGFGTLGGGNVTIRVGGDAGVIASRGTGLAPASQGLNIAIGSTGRVLADGSVVKTGGGDLTLDVAGAINPLHPRLNVSSVSNSNVVVPMLNDLSGVITDLRGNAAISAGSIGRVDLTYGSAATNDPRAPDVYAANLAVSSGGMTIMPGDAKVTIEARGDLVIGGTGDAGDLMTRPNTTSYTLDGQPFTGGGRTIFSLYTPDTSLSALSAGGNLTPYKASTVSSIGSGLQNADDTTAFAMQGPSVMQFAALSGSAYLDGSITLLSSPVAQLSLAAAQSIYGAGGNISMNGGDMIHGAPAHPIFSGENFSEIFSLFDTVKDNVHAGDNAVIRFYAVQGDIIDLASGAKGMRSDASGLPVTQYVAAEPVWMRAGRDLVNVSGLALNNDADDVSSLSAGRDIIYANMQIAGPGLLDVTAGRNINQADQGQITSIGAIAEGDTRPGASVVMLAGAGAAGPDYAALARYLDPANVADPSRPLADQPGKVARSYEPELLAWLAQQSGFAGTGEEARTYFAGLPADQQNIFLRQVYFGELRAGGREYNDPDSKRFGSYLRGRDVIAALFPQSGYAGDITMFGGAGVRTQFGGDIQMLAPGGQIVIGVEGLTPPPTAGVVTQGAGDIQMYSQGSILLGLSRIMTTFGGDILAWSAEGDINAGRGSKTTVLFTPPRRVYDNVGDVALAPQAPSSGAGIATLNPIPEVPAGDVDLIAPLGTIDAGEAGIRVSGNVNLAALQVVNAANIQVQGKSTGLPLIATVNVNALTNASAAATQAAITAQDVVNRERTAARQALPSIFTVRVLGFGNEAPAAPAGDAGSQPVSYDPHSTVRVLGVGELPESARAQLTARERSRLGGL